MQRGKTTGLYCWLLLAVTAAAAAEAPTAEGEPATKEAGPKMPSGQPVGGALVLAYSLGDFLRWPFKRFARADANGSVTLPLARGSSMRR